MTYTNRFLLRQISQFPSVDEVKEIADLIGQDFEEVYQAALVAYFDINNLHN